VQRARRYVQKCDPAISGQGGHNQTYKVAIALVRGFALDEDTALKLLRSEYNPKCEPPWPEKDLIHKVNEAGKAPDPLGYLLEPSTPQRPRAEERRTMPTRAANNGHAGEGEGKKEVKRPRIINAKALDKIQFPPIRWAVPGLIPEGVTLLAGRPKLGKSWLALGVAVEVAQGGRVLGQIAVDKGQVLYLALEDGERRVQKRIRNILSKTGASAPAELEIAVEWPRTTEGGEALLEEWFKEHPAGRLAVIDTLARVRDKSTRELGQYAEDYAAIAPYQKLATQLNRAVLIVTHTRKPKQGAEDFLDEVQATSGITGCADQVMVLNRQRFLEFAELAAVGRDLEDEVKLPLAWEKEHCLWYMRDPSSCGPDDHCTQVQTEIRVALRTAGRPLMPAEIAKALNKKVNAVSQTLGRMLKDGLVEKTERGKYTCQSM
jgi:hypothetical protein